MPGSQTALGRVGARNGAPVRIAFRYQNGVGAQDDVDFAAQWLAYAIPCRRFADALADKIGPDIGVTNRSELVWSVYAPTPLRRRARALVGNYVGASADAAIGVGGGANLLVGGSNATISLQPVSVKTQTGLAVGAGLGQLQLR